jgi:ribosome-binding protein aMBF1 (putative translation factor)
VNPEVSIMSDDNFIGFDTIKCMICGDTILVNPQEVGTDINICDDCKIVILTLRKKRRNKKDGAK